MLIISLDLMSFDPKDSNKKMNSRKCAPKSEHQKQDEQKPTDKKKQLLYGVGGVRK